MAHGVEDEDRYDRREKNDDHKFPAVSRHLYLVKMRSRLMDLPVVEVGQHHPDLLRGKTGVLQPFPDPLGLKEFFRLLKIGGPIRRG
jgi:hypothetical protein